MEVFRVLPHIPTAEGMCGRMVGCFMAVNNIFSNEWDLGTYKDFEKAKLVTD